MMKNILQKLTLGKSLTPSEREHCADEFVRNISSVHPVLHDLVYTYNCSATEEQYTNLCKEHGVSPKLLLDLERVANVPRHPNNLIEVTPDGQAWLHVVMFGSFLCWALFPQNSNK